jgi:HEAT repeat protein
MINFLRNLQIDQISFWLGFLAGILFGWLITLIRRNLPLFINYGRKLIQAAREELATSTETRIRNDMIQYAQKQHIAYILFSLDEIIVPPAFLPPPCNIDDETDNLLIDPVSELIPYTPDWPEMSTTYQVPTLSLAEALKNNANLVLIGKPGSGKTVTLAYLTSLIARRDPGLGDLASYVPLLISAADINPINEQKSATQVLIDAVANSVSKLTLPRLAETIQNLLEQRSLILLIDNLDEVSEQIYNQVINFIQQIFQSYPELRLITATNHERMKNILSLGFHPLALLPWDYRFKEKFIEKWEYVWSRFGPSSGSTQSTSGIDPYLLNSWLYDDKQLSTPFEFTLRVWATYSGDITGPDIYHCMDAYFQRIIAKSPGSRRAIEQIAVQSIKSGSFFGSENEFNNWLLDLDQYNVLNGEKESEIDHNPVEEDKAENIHYKGAALIEIVKLRGLLLEHPTNRYRFVHILFPAYLAGYSLAQQNKLLTISEFPDWLGKDLSISFLANETDISSYIQSVLRKDDFFHDELLQMARWVNPANKTQSWQMIILRQLASCLQKEIQSRENSARILSALAISNDPGVIFLFRQLTKSNQREIQQLAALACGITQDIRLIPDLSNLLQQDDPGLSLACCLALISIGDKSALEIVASTLLNGSESQRRAAAQALANHPQEGHPALQEGSSMPDLLVRRSVVHGLARIRAEWSIKILEKISLDDQEWVVRNTAIQLLEDIKKPNRSIPLPHPKPEETPWLIDYATRQGIGVAPGKQAFDLIHRALQNGEFKERVAALRYLQNFGIEESVPLIFDIYVNASEREIREAAYTTLWFLQRNGIQITPPSKK